MTTENKQNTIYFLHGLDSSGKGTKGCFFAEHFPNIIAPDFSGNLRQRIEQLKTLTADQANLTLIGSSFGGLMATCFAEIFPEKVRKIVLLAPALNFEQHKPPRDKIDVPTILVVGDEDDVCPPNIIIPLANKSFSSISIEQVEDDHMLHKTFKQMNWSQILQIQL